MPISPADSRDLDWQEEWQDEAETACTDPARLGARLREELRELEPVVTAATLATVAFRMRDEAGLVAALRALTEAIEALDRARAEG